MLNPTFALAKMSEGLGWVQPLALLEIISLSH